jgi:hypothetical protein
MSKDQGGSGRTGKRRVRIQAQWRKKSFLPPTAKTVRKRLVPPSFPPLQMGKMQLHSDWFLLKAEIKEEGNSSLRQGQWRTPRSPVNLRRRWREIGVRGSVRHAFHGERFRM